MMQKQRISFLLIVLYQIVIGTSSDISKLTGEVEAKTAKEKASLKFKFNLTSAHCYDPEEGSEVDLTGKWFIKTTADLASSYCYDSDGMGYKYGSYITTCCQCMQYRCYYGSQYSAGRIQYFVYWYLYRVASECCQDCEGAVFPPDQVMDVTTMEDECLTEVTSVCKHNDAISRYSGVIIKTYQPFNCCLDSTGLTPAHQTKLDLSSCSIKNCTLGKPSFWVDTPVFPGECNCCEFNGSLVREGGEVEVPPGLTATCCDGNMVVNYTKTVTEPPRWCAEPKPGCDESEKVCEKCEYACQEKNDVCKKTEIICNDYKKMCSSDMTAGSPECVALEKECEGGRERCKELEDKCAEQKKICHSTYCDVGTG